MEPVTLTLSSDVSMIPIAQAAAAAYCRAAGAGGEVAVQTELVIEEIVTNILQYEYLPGQHETITLTLSLREGVLACVIRFRGIPFDVALLKRWEKQTDTRRIVESGGRGLGLRLLGQLCGEVDYRNRGWEGQEIRIRRAIPVREGPSEPAEETKAPPEPSRVVIRRMRPDEAAAISRLAYFAYRYTYIREEAYEPEQVRIRNADGRMKSYVIVDDRSGEVIGHMAQFPDHLFGAAPELAAGFVHPYFRRGGSFNGLTEVMIRDAQAEGWQGVCGMAVTSHRYSQLAAIRSGMRESALLVSHVRPLEIAHIKDQALSRESFLYLVRMFTPNTRQPYYAPPRHREMMARILENIAVPAAFAETPADVPLPDRGRMDRHRDTQLCGHLVIRGWGRDSLRDVQAVLRGWCLDRLETICLYLPLGQPATAVYSTDLEAQGFFFAGIMPGQDGADWLVMQYLNNQRYDYTALQAATAFGKTLIDYVSGCDPR